MTLERDLEMKLVYVFSLLAVCVLAVTSPVLCSDKISIHLPPPRPMHVKLSLDFLGIPKFGEEATLVCLATPDIDIPRMRIDFQSSEGVEILSGPGTIHTSARKGETKAYKVRIGFKPGRRDVYVRAYMRVTDDMGKEFWQESGWAHTGHMFVVDEKTGRLGSWDEYRNSKLVFRYDAAMGRWLENGHPNYAVHSSTIIERLQELEPALSDSEALCLHVDIISPETPYRHPGPVRWRLDRNDMEKYLLDRGWLEKHRQGDHVKVPWLRALSDSLGKEWEEVREEFEKRDRLELERMQGADDTLRQGQEESELKGGRAQITVSSEPGAPADNPAETDEVPFWGAILPARTTLEVSQYSRIGDEVELICTVTPDVDVPKLRVSFTFQMGAEPVSEPTVFYVSAKKGEPKTCRVGAKFTSAPVKITANVASCFKDYRGEEVVRPSRSAILRLYLVDEETGLLGTAPSESDLSGAGTGEYVEQSSSGEREPLPLFGVLPARIVVELSNEPMLDEEVNVICKVTPEVDVPNMKIRFGFSGEIELVSGERHVYTSARKGETKTCQVGVVFKSRSVILGVQVYEWRQGHDGREMLGASGSTILRYVLADSATGRFVPLEEFLAMEPANRYDIATGTIYPPGQYYGSGPYARTMIEKLKKLEPRLTDWEAIYLHRDALRAYEAGIGTGDDRGEDERIHWLLQEGWLEKQRGGEEIKEKCLQELFERKLQEQDGSELNGGCIQVTGRNERPSSDSLPDRPDAEPKLIWEKEFDKDIVSVGVDAERFDPKKQNITNCLKWIQFEGAKFYLFDARHADLGESLGVGSKASASRSTRYFTVSQRNPEAERGYNARHYRLLDWSGKVIWETDCPGLLSPRVSNDASAAFLELSMDDLWTWIHGARFYSPKGHLLHEYTFDEGRLLFGDYSSSSNGSFSILTTRKGVFVFGRAGEAIWSRGRVENYGMEYRGNTEHGDWFRRAAVTDSGEVLLVHRIDSSHFRLAAHDAQGFFVDSRAFNVGTVFDLEAAGRTVFASMTHASGTGPNRIFLYDFASRQAKTIVEEPLYYFMALDVNAGANLAAVVATNEHARDIRILVYGFSGERRGEVRLPEAEYSNPWFKLLRNALLVAEGKKLKLYALNSDD